MHLAWDNHRSPRHLPGPRRGLLLRSFLKQRFCPTALFWRIREFTSVDVGHFMPVALCGREDFQICLIYKDKYSLRVERACQEISQRDKLLRQGHSNDVFQPAISLLAVIPFLLPSFHAYSF